MTDEKDAEEFQEKDESAILPEEDISSEKSSSVSANSDISYGSLATGGKQPDTSVTTSQSAPEKVKVDSPDAAGSSQHSFVVMEEDESTRNESVNVALNGRETGEEATGPVGFVKQAKEICEQIALKEITTAEECNETKDGICGENIHEGEITGIPYSKQLTYNQRF